MLYDVCQEGEWEDFDVSPLQVTHARTHARSHSHRPFVCCQSPIVKALPSASHLSIRQRMLTYADVCCC
jgi:hypothetical protein